MNNSLLTNKLNSPDNSSSKNSVDYVFKQHVLKYFFRWVVTLAPKVSLENKCAEEGGSENWLLCSRNE